MSVHINDLSYDLLKYILNFLPEKQLFILEIVCTKWQKCVKKLLAQKDILHRLDYYSPKFQNHSSQGKRVIIHSSNIHILKNILSRCPNIKQMDLSDTKLTGKNNLIAIALMCPKLERINFNGSDIDVSHDEINEFAKLIGPQLIQCSLIFVYNLNLILFKHFENIANISFTSDVKEEDKILFDYLDINCKSLKVFHKRWCTSGRDFDFQNNHLINVIQRIQYLKIDLSNLLQFKFFEMDNLTELTIYQGFEIKKIIAFRIIFPNLKKLNIINFSDLSFDSISKFEFPILESVIIVNEFYYDIPTSFIHQIKHIKSLKYDCYDFTLIPKIVLSMNQLVNFAWTEISLSDSYSFSQIYQCFDLLSRHESVQNIVFDINDSGIKIGMDFFQKFITLCKVKPKTIMEITIRKPTNLSNHPKLEKNINHYIKLFYEIKHQHKLNMKLSYRYIDEVH